MKLEPGTRVRVHDICQETGEYTTDTGTVIRIDDKRVAVKCDNWTNLCGATGGTRYNWFCVAQCRRLVKKRRRVVWLTFNKYGDVEDSTTNEAAASNPAAPRPWVKFIEVRGK